MENIQISADGSMSSDYVDEFEPSLTLNVNQTFRMHAGSKMEVITGQFLYCLPLD